MAVPEAEFSLGEAASAPQLNVQLPVSSSEPRAVGPSRGSLKGTSSVQSCTGSFAIPVQGAFKLLLISTVSLGLRLQINEKHKCFLEEL